MLPLHRRTRAVVPFPTGRAWRPASGGARLLYPAVATRCEYRTGPSDPPRLDDFAVEAPRYRLPWIIGTIDANPANEAPSGDASEQGQAPPRRPAPERRGVTPSSPAQPGQARPGHAVGDNRPRGSEMRGARQWWCIGAHPASASAGLGPSGLNLQQPIFRLPAERCHHVVMSPT